MRNKKIVNLIAAFSFFLVLNPSYVWGTPFPGIALIVFSLICSLWSTKKVSDNKFFLVLILLLVYFLNLRHLTTYAFLFFLVIPILVADDEGKILIYGYCKNVYAVIVAVSIIFFIMVVYMQIDMPNYIIDASNQNKKFDYVQYPMLVVPNDITHLNFIYRFHFILDEPGAVGTLATMFLLAENYTLNKWQNIIVFISGILSLSLFFFICTVLYIVFYKLKSAKGLISVTIIVGFVVWGFWYVDSNFFEISNLLGDRLEFDNGHLSGDNRSNESFDVAYERFLIEGNDILFGKGEGAHNRIAPGIQTYKMVIYDNGLVYVILSALFFLSYAIGQLNKYPKRCITYLLFYVFLYYQRPAYVLLTPYFFLLLVIPIIWKNANHRASLITKGITSEAPSKYNMG